MGTFPTNFMFPSRDENPIFVNVEGGAVPSLTDESWKPEFRTTHLDDAEWKAEDRSAIIRNLPFGRALDDAALADLNAKLNERDRTLWEKRSEMTPRQRAAALIQYGFESMPGGVQKAEIERN